MKLAPIRRGDPRLITVSVKDNVGAPINLAASTWTSTLRVMANSTSGVPLSIDASQASAGVLGLSLTGSQSRTLSNTFVGDLQGTGFGTILDFYGIVREDVTRDGTEPEGSLTVDNISVTWGGVQSTLSSSVMAILVKDLGGGVSPATVSQMINTHIDDLTPHPAYDDLASLKLIFENGLI